MREAPPSPPWGRGWPATGVFTSRGRTGVGVKPVKTPYPDRKTRSLARSAGQIDKAREFRQTPAETEHAAWHLLRGLRSRGFKFRRWHPMGPYIADYCGTELRSSLDPLTRLGAADESAAPIHPLPQRGEGPGALQRAAKCRNSPEGKSPSAQRRGGAATFS